MTEDKKRTVDEYLSWRTNIAITMTYLNTAIRALEQAEFGLAGLKACPRVNDYKLRQDLAEYEDRLKEIRDVVYTAQGRVRDDAHRALTVQSDEQSGIQLCREMDAMMEDLLEKMKKMEGGD